MNFSNVKIEFVRKDDFETIVKRCVVNNEFDYNGLKRMPNVIRNLKADIEETFNISDQIAMFEEMIECGIPINKIYKDYLNDKERKYFRIDASVLYSGLWCLEHYGVFDRVHWMVKNWRNYEVPYASINTDKLTINLFYEIGNPKSIVSLIAEEFSYMDCYVSWYEYCNEGQDTFDYSIVHGTVFLDEHEFYGVDDIDDIELKVSSDISEFSSFIKKNPVYISTSQ